MLWLNYCNSNHWIILQLVYGWYKDKQRNIIKHSIYAKKTVYLHVQLCNTWWVYLIPGICSFGRMNEYTDEFCLGQESVSSMRCQLTVKVSGTLLKQKIWGSVWRNGEKIHVPKKKMKIISIKCAAYWQKKKLSLMIHVPTRQRHDLKLNIYLGIYQKEQTNPSPCSSCFH